MSSNRNSCLVMRRRSLEPLESYHLLHDLLDVDGRPPAQEVDHLLWHGFCVEASVPVTKKNTHTSLTYLRLVHPTLAKLKCKFSLRSVPQVNRKQSAYHCYRWFTWE